MKINKVVVGILNINCYILEIQNKVIVIDPGDCAEKICKIIGNREVIGIIITHYHFDHIGALEELKNKYNVPVWDYKNLIEGENKILDFNFDMIKTPGHKEDLISIYFKNENVLFCGDFIFKESIGRWDLPGGNINDMKKSIKKILECPKDMIIFPGHGPQTTLREETENLKYYYEMF